MIRQQDRAESIDSIIACVCEYAGLDHHGAAQLFMKTRVKNISELRKISAYLIRKHTHSTLTDIANVFNRTDHTTCIHWVKWTESQMNRCDLFRNSINRIENMRQLLQVDSNKIRVIRERVLDMGEDND